MTVTYTAKVATSSFSCFLRLLLRWRGSIYKLLWKDFVIFAAGFYLLNFIYRFALNDAQKRIFELVVGYCEAYNNLIPVAFVLGFYVSIVVSRWWEQFNSIPWPDRFALFVTANVHGHDDHGRLMRRTMMRYLCLSYVITMHSISPAVKKRFPTFQHMTDAGFMLPNEQKIIEAMKTPHNKYFIPLAWCTSLVTRARKEIRIKDDFAVKTLIDEINEFRGKLGGLFNFDWISIPLVYTQVVTLAVYMFFISCLMGRQFVEQGGTTYDMYFPLFTFLQFCFYMGWLKVAECLVNPFGEDDDDFDINMVIDRNLQVSYMVVDEMHEEHPELIRDAYWESVNFELPYTAASESYKPTEPYLGSAMEIRINKDDPFVPLDSIREEPSRPTDIPRSKRPSAFAQDPSNPLKSLLKRSSSLAKKHPDTSPSLNNMRLQRMGSLTSQDTQTAPSPSHTLLAEEVFDMELEEAAEINRLVDEAIDNTDGAVGILHKISVIKNRAKARRSQRESLRQSEVHLEKIDEKGERSGEESGERAEELLVEAASRLGAPRRSVSMGEQLGLNPTKL